MTNNNKWQPGRRYGAAAPPSSLQGGMERLIAQRGAARVSASSEQAPVELEQANDLFRQRRHEPALAAYNRLLQTAKDPVTRSAAAYGVGLIMLERGDDKTAALALNDSVRLSPANVNALYYLGIISNRAHDYNSAFQTFTRVLALEPTHAGALHELAALGHTPTGSRAHPPTPASAVSLPPQSRPVTTAASSQATPPGPPRQPKSTASTVGIARHVRTQVVPWRGKPAAMTQMTFRVEVPGQAPGHGDLLSVEMRGHEVHGIVEDGDWVEVAAGQRFDKPVKEIFNLTTGSRVYSKFRIFGAQ